MTTDQICNIGQTFIQHGKVNDRVYLMKLSEKDNPKSIIAEIDNLSERNGYSKAFAKVPKSALDDFIASGYICEAEIPGFFSGKVDGFFLSKYYNPERGRIENREEIDAIVKKPVSVNIRTKNLPKGFKVRRADKDDAKSLSELYGEVFESYPFPVHDESYLKETMDENIEYFGIWEGNRLIAASSCETDISSLNVEMTDLAVSADYRGRGLSGILLSAMEAGMAAKGYITAYTIARAAFGPVNYLFKSHGYKFTGTLKNNTNICGSFESMNVWYKKIID